MSEYIYGKNVVKAVLDYPKRIKCVFIEENNKEFIELVQRKKINYKIVNKQVINQLVSGLHQGVVCEVEDYKLYSLEELIKETSYYPPTLIMLDGIEDPHNLGAIMRIADATKVQGIILPKNRSVGLTGTVAKVSTGAIEYVKVCEVVNLVNTIKFLKNKGYWIVALENIKQAADYRSINYDMPTVIIIGSEGKGISRLVLENSDFKVKLPMYGTVNSLNASVSCGIVLYEILKYRKE